MTLVLVWRIFKAKSSLPTPPLPFSIMTGESYYFPPCCGLCDFQSFAGKFSYHVIYQVLLPSLVVEPYPCPWIKLNWRYQLSQELASSISRSRKSSSIMWSPEKGVLSCSVNLHVQIVPPALMVYDHWLHGENCPGSWSKRPAVVSRVKMQSV